MNFRNEKIKNKISEIHDILSFYTNDSDFSILNGEAGLAVFFYQHNLLFNKNYNLELRVENCFDLISKTPDVVFSHCDGLSGVVWLYHFFEKEGLFEQADNLVQDIYSPLLLLSVENVKFQNYDFLHGSIGQIMWLVEKFKDENKTIVEFIDTLNKNKTETKNGYYWGISHKGETEINFGISHGIPAIIIFLCKCYSNNIAKDLCKDLISNAIRFITYYKNKTSDSVYPQLFKLNQEKIPSAERLAWCWGDLGLAVMFLEAGKALNNKSWREEAIYIMQRSCSRRDLRKNRTVDAGLCHGTSGIAHIFNRFYWETGLIEFKETANYWIEQTLEMAYHTDGLAGFKAYHGQDNWVKNYGLLEGIAGIGLALMSHISDKEPTWDSCLLLSSN